MAKRANGEGTAVARRADGRWESRIRFPDGSRKTVYGRTQVECKEKKDALLKEYSSYGQVADRRITVKDYLQTWLKTVAKPNLKPTTFQTYEGHIKRNIEPVLGHLRLAQVRPEHIRRLLSDIQDRRKLSQSTARQSYAILRKALGDAVRDGTLTSNPVLRVKPPTVENDPVKPLSSKEVAAFLKATKGERLAAVYTVALGTGMREGEILALAWEDIDFEKNVLQVRHNLQPDNTGKLALQTPKSAESRRTVHMVPAVAQALQQHRKLQAEEKLALAKDLRWGGTWTREFVFTTTTGTPIRASNFLRRSFKPKMREVVPDRNVTFHHLRHTCASFLADMGLDLFEIKNILGHSQIGVTDKLYAHFTAGHAKKVSDRMTKAFAGLL